MRKTVGIIALLAIILLCGILSSCAPSNFYKTVQQPPIGSDEIKAAVEFKVRPIDFRAIKYTDMGYASGKEWMEEIESVPQALAEGFKPRYILERKMDKKVIMLKEGDPVASGIVVQTAVRSIVQRWNYFSQEPDEYTCSITFTDAATGRELFSGVVLVKSRPAQTSTVGGSGFGGGGYAVGPELSFGGRLRAGARNIGWVLTKIMKEGRIEPVSR